MQPWPREHHPELWTRFGMPAPPAAPWTMFAGRYQPYGVWLPERLPEPAPLVVFLHGTGSNHLSNASRSFFGVGCSVLSLMASRSMWARSSAIRACGTAR